MTIRFEDRDSLYNGIQDKIDKYSRLRTDFLERWPGREFVVKPLVFGSCGSLPELTKEYVFELGFSKPQAIYMFGYFKINNFYGKLP